MTTLANEWASRHEVSLLTLTGDETGDFYHINQDVRRIRLGLAGRSNNKVAGVLRNVNRVLALRSMISTIHPDVLVAFMESSNVLALIASAGRWPVIISERVHPLHAPCGLGWRIARRVLYRFCSRLVVQTSDISRCFAYVPKRKRATIANPVPPHASCARAEGITCTNKRLRLLAIGRLSTQKGFDLLLDALHIVRHSGIDADLTVFGNGAEFSKLNEKIGTLGMGNCARIHPPTLVDRSLFSRFDLFVLSSRYEGFPNALCEAMAAGLAVISFDCPSGPAQIIENGVNGLLVPPEDISSLASSITRLAIDVALRRQLAQAAMRVSSQFSVQRIASQWEDIFSASLTQS